MAKIGLPKGSGKWLKVREKSGNFEMDFEWQPCSGSLVTLVLDKIRIHHEFESGIGKSVPRITIWHHEACRVMTNGDPE